MSSSLFKVFHSPLEFYNSGMLHQTPKNSLPAKGEPAMLRFSAFLLPAVLLFLPFGANAQTPSKLPANFVTFTIIKGDLLTTLVRLERQYQIQCVLQDSVDAHSKINMAVSDVPLSLALRVLASNANAQVTQSPDGVYLFTPRLAVISADPNYSMPPPHFFGGFGPPVPGGNLPYPPVVFPHAYRPPTTLSNMLNERDPGYTPPEGVRRIFALGKSF